MVGLRVLDRKVLRDLVRMWSQSLAIALVMACGVMTLILAMGAYRSLTETRDAYYDRYRFADVFAGAVSAPRTLEPALAAIDGVSAVQLRLRAPVIVDMPGMVEPAAGVVLSLPAGEQPRVNRLFLRAGALPTGHTPGEIALDERFALAHGLGVGDGFGVTIMGRKMDLTIAAVVLGPEFIYSPDPSALAPDDRRYAVLYLPEGELATLIGREGAFNDAVFTLSRGACARCVAAAVDDVLAPYGGQGATLRDKQHSHAFLDAELTGLQSMAKVVPPVFLLVSAFLVNMILTRLIALEREQIGLLKANGYSNAAVGAHYAKLVAGIAFIGLAIGAATGGYLGRAMTALYGEFYRFPFLIYHDSPDLYVIAGSVSLAAALAGAARAIWGAVRLPPAVAMRPPAPQRFSRLIPWPAGRFRIVSRLSIMAVRHMMHNPVRSGLTTLAVGFSVSLMVSALFFTDALDFMIEEQFYRAERADAQVGFAGALGPGAELAVARLPGVLRTEPVRNIDAILRNGPVSERIGISARPPEPVLSRVLDADGEPVAMPAQGVLLTHRLAAKLGVGTGQKVEVELPGEGGRIVDVPVAGIVQSYVGLGAYMSLEAATRLMSGGPRLTGVAVETDPMLLPALYAAVKASPGIGSIGLNNLSRDAFQDLMDENMGIMMGAYAAIAIIVAFGVVYNSARIQLSERARELASLRVLGFTRGEVYAVLAIELVLIVGAAQPLGWGLGYLIAWGVTEGFSSDLFRIPLVINPPTYVQASLVVLAAALASALILRWRVSRLDLIRVLKTRE